VRFGSQIRERDALKAWDLATLGTKLHGNKVFGTGEPQADRAAKAEAERAYENF